MSTPKRSAAKRSAKPHRKDSRSEWYRVNTSTAEVESVALAETDALLVDETLSLTTPPADPCGDTAELHRSGKARHEKVSPGCAQEDVPTMELPQQKGQTEDNGT